jgi:glucose/arabinose dehydrogenase
MDATGKSRLAAACVVAGLILGCGGGSSGDGAPTGTGQAPVPSIDEPAQGRIYQAGGTLRFSASATDAEDGRLPASALTWWAEFHHGDHTHPFVPPTPGSEATIAIPVRGETSDDVFYRIHLRATDSSGLTTQTTRDIMPRKARIHFATQPPGLILTLDGQPLTAPASVVGVTGMERELGAADQTSEGRRYRFDRWAHGQPASHTLSTPAADTTYTASFTDLGPVTNQPPSVDLSAPATGTVGRALRFAATAGDADGQVAQVQFYVGATLLHTDTASPYSFDWTPTSAGHHTLTARATDDQGATTVSGAIGIEIAASGGGDVQAPTASLTSPADLAQHLTGTLQLSAQASDDASVAAVEFQVDGASVGVDTTAPYAVTIDTRAYPRGQHILRARARDSAGNLSPWSRATVTFHFTSPSLPAGFSKQESWVTGLGSATAFAQASDGGIFVCEQGGSLRVVKNGTLLPTPFHRFVVDANGERGLLGVAFHPQFASNGWVYVYYTATTPTVHNRISRLVASGDVSTGAETVLVDLPTLGSQTHNGGALHFGPDGKLYVAVGDNGSGTRAANQADPFGKILRFNEDGTIPSDNPYYADNSGLARAVWAYGLRNPFTFGFQAGTGRMHINDVGQASWEEINLGQRGANYGWPGSEGPDRVSGDIVGPLYAYSHRASDPPGSGPGGFLMGSAITGAAFYPDNGSFPPAFRNSYYFADYGHRWISRLDLDNEGDAYSFAHVDGPPVDLLVGHDGALYVLKQTGSIARIAP